MKVEIQLHSGRWLAFDNVAETDAEEDFGHVFLTLYNEGGELMGSVAMSSIESVAYIEEDGDE